MLDNTLRIDDARLEDQGRYVCRGHNEGGNVSVVVSLFVYGKYSWHNVFVWSGMNIKF